MSEKYFIGRDLTGFESTGEHDPITRVTLYVDEANCYTAGNDSGKELKANCPSATQEMVNSLLEALQGYSYKSYTADSANIDPAAELGDGITVGGLYSVYAKSADRGDGFPNVSAPGEKALDEEYPMPSKGQQYTNRKIAQTRSLISKTAEEIMLEVNDLSGKYTQVSVTLDGLTVTDQSGTTLIRGNMIQTDTLYVNAANVTGTLTAGQINLTGAITFGDLDDNVSGSISGAASTASSAYTIARQIANGTYKGTFINERQIFSPTIYAEEFSVMPTSVTEFGETGGSFNLYGYYGSTLYHFLQIQYFAGDSPAVWFKSPDDAVCYMHFDELNFSGRAVDFTGTTVTGLTATFG